MPQLRVVSNGLDVGEPGGEIFACSFSPEGMLVLSGGWDGQLRLWEGSTGAPVTALPASQKPLSACAVSPDGKQWLAGSMEGLLTLWDPALHIQRSSLLAHTRPVSAIVFAPDGLTIATAAWDRRLVLWRDLGDRDGRPLLGHEDIITGCRFTPDGSRLVSWSHDRSVRIWEVLSGRIVSQFTGHHDRVTAGAVSPDGCWVATGARDRVMKLWNLQTEREEHAICLGGEVRGCQFLLDGSSLVSVDSTGRVVLHSLPDLRAYDELLTRWPVQCMELSPRGDLLAFGCSDGLVRFLALDGLDEFPLVVTPTQTQRITQSRFERLLGRRRLTHAYSCTCPVCGQQFELPEGVLGADAMCPACRRRLRLSRVARVAQP